MSPTSGSWSKVFRGVLRTEVPRASEYWQHFGSVYCEYSQFFRIQCSRYSDYCKYFGFCVAEYCLQSRFSTAHTHEHYVGLEYCSYSE